VDVQGPVTAAESAKRDQAAAAGRTALVTIRAFCLSPNANVSGLLDQLQPGALQARKAEEAAERAEVAKAEE